MLLDGWDFLEWFFDIGRVFVDFGIGVMNDISRDG